MKKAIALLIAAVLIAAVGSGLLADEKTKTGEKQQVVIHKHTDLVGKAVKNKTNEHLGYIEDLVIAVPSGRLNYVGFSTKNALGLGGKLYALPMSAFSMASDYSHLILDVAKNAFDSAPAFDPNAWPDKVTHESWAKLGKERKPIDPKKDHHLLRVTSISGLAVRNHQGEDLGKVHGFAVDCTNDKISYAAVTYGGVAGIGTKYFAVPWEAMSLKPLNLRLQDCCFALNMLKKDFETGTGFENTSWPNSGDRRFLPKDAPKTSSK